MPDTATEKRLVLLIAEYGYFVSHRLALAQAAVADGYRVSVITRLPAGIAAAPQPDGIEIIPFVLRRGLSPFADLAAVLRLAVLLRRLRPALLHNVSIKLAILGTLAARLAGVRHVVNAYTGLGHLFRSSGAAMTCLRWIVSPVLWLMAWQRETWSVFQNQDDLDRFRRRGLARLPRIALIEGSGVDLRVFVPTPPPSGAVLVLFAGRLLKDKGIGEFVAAARILRDRGLPARFAALGDPDPENPTSVEPAILESWRAEGIVEWWGRRTDMAAVYREASVVCLPSHHEGLPKVILEAGASARPVVASRIPGCAAVIDDTVTGLLVPVRDVPALAGALATLINDADLRASMGRAARARIEERFSDAIVNRRFLELYRTMSHPAGDAAGAL